MGQERIKISEDLYLTTLSKNTFIHTCDRSNGVVYIQGKEAIIVSTPPSDIVTAQLINWVQDSLGVKIIAYIIDRWHPDAMEGLDVIQKYKITSYAYEQTRAIAKEKNLPIPDRVFNPKQVIKIDQTEVICHFLGEAHTSDGIVVWFPKEQILFGGNEVRNFNGWVGNIGDANLEAWSETIQKVKKEYGNAKIVVPGHGKHGGVELLDYTIQLYQPNSWAAILKAHDVLPKTIFQNDGRIFIIAEQDSLVEENQYLSHATVFVRQNDKYYKLQANKIKYNKDKKSIYSPNGRLQLYSKNDPTKTLDDLYYDQLYLGLRDDAVGITVVIKKMYYQP